MRAINRYIIVRAISEEVVSSSGLLLSSDDVNEMRYKKAKVHNVGTAVEGIKDGDYIYYDKSAGHSIVLDGDKYTVILDRDVVVVL